MFGVCPHNPKASYDRTARHKLALGFVGIVSPVFLDGQKAGLQFAQRRFKGFGANAGSECGTTLFAIQNVAMLCHSQRLAAADERPQTHYRYVINLRFQICQETPPRDSQASRRAFYTHEPDLSVRWRTSGSAGLPSESSGLKSLDTSQSLVFNSLSWASIKFRISSLISSNFFHCSL